LCNEPRLSWESARNKLSRAESISEYYKDNVLNRLQMSIDILDDEPKQCFVDLGAFPKGRKFGVDSLLDIWVYVHGMEREDAFVVLLEIAKRNLLNLTSNPGYGTCLHSINLLIATPVFIYFFQLNCFYCGILPYSINSTEKLKLIDIC